MEIRNHREREVVRSESFSSPVSVEQEVAKNESTLELGIEAINRERIIPSDSVLHTKEEYSAKLDAIYEDSAWRASDKFERTAKLKEATSLIHCRFLAISSELESVLEKIPNFDKQGIQQDANYLEHILAQEGAHELYARELLSEVLELRTVLANGPVRLGMSEFKSSTGWLDSAPKTSRSIAALSATASLGYVAVVLTEHHHAIHHFFSHQIPSFGANWLADSHFIISAVVNWSAGAAHWVASEVCTVIPFVPEATVLIALGATTGALAWGGLKASAGLFMRNLPLFSTRNYFNKQKDASTALQDNIKACIDDGLEGVLKIEYMLARFYQRNEVMRQPVAASSWFLRKSGQDIEQADRLRKSEASIGKNEDIDIWEAGLVHGNLQGLRKKDIRSHALLSNVDQDEPKEKWSYLNPIATIGLGFRTGRDALMSLWSTAYCAGTESAIMASDEFDQMCRSGQNSIAAPIYGLGHASAKALNKITKSSDLQEAILSTAEAFFSMTDVSKEWHQGPTLQEIFKEGLAVEQSIELKEEKKKKVDLLKEFGKQTLRFATPWSLFDKKPVLNIGFQKGLRQISKRAWKVWTEWGYLSGASAFNAVILAVKKPVVAQSLMLKRAESGNPTPGLIEKELAKKKGRLAEAKVGVREIIEIARHSASGLFYRLPREIPLGIGARLQRNDSFFAFLFPKNSAQVLLEGYQTRLEEKRNGEHGVLHFERVVLEDGKTLATTPIDLLKNVCNKAKREFFEADEKNIDEEELNKLYKRAHSLAEYWAVRNAEHWLERKMRVLNHINTLASIDPRLENLREVAEPSAKKLQKWIKEERKKQIHTRDAKLPIYPELVEYARKFNEKPLPTSNTRRVLHTGPSGELIVLEKDGTLSFLEQNEAWQQIVDEWDSENPEISLYVLDNADEARLVLAAEILGTLEPIQKSALILAHHDAILNVRDIKKQTRDLLVSDFIPSQLFGDIESTQSKYAFPGIYRLGIIGNTIASDEILQS